MDQELQLGFYRLGRKLQDPINLLLAIVFAWAVIAILIGAGLALGLGLTFLLMVIGAGVIVLLRHRIDRLAWRLRDQHEELEGRQGEREPATPRAE